MKTATSVIQQMAFVPSSAWASLENDRRRSAGLNLEPPPKHFKPKVWKCFVFLTLSELRIADIATTSRKNRDIFVSSPKISLSYREVGFDSHLC